MMGRTGGGSRSYHMYVFEAQACFHSLHIGNIYDMCILFVNRSLLGQLLCSLEKTKIDYYFLSETAASLTKKCITNLYQF
jgi:hypothetical protein